MSDDVVIAGLVRRAWGWVAAFVTSALATVGVSASAHLAGRASNGAALGGALLVVTAIAAGFAVVASGRPIRRRTAFDVDFMVSRVWLPGFMGLVIPPVALVDAVLRLTSASIGGYQTTQRDGASGRYYPSVALAQGEGRPLGAALLAIATLWPAAVASVVVVRWLFGR